MKLLLDQGVPRSATVWLEQAGHDAVHVADVGLSAADDLPILEHARSEGRVVVTLDADFHMLLAVTGAAQPSAIRIRMQGLRGREMAELLTQVVQRCEDDLRKGALVSVRADGVHVRRLPIL